MSRTCHAWSTARQRYICTAPGVASVIPGQVPRRAQSELNEDSAGPARQIALLQLGIYSLVGGICFCIDVGGFVALRSLKLPILTASVLSFVTATLVNYLLCCGFVFRRGRFSRREEIVRLFIIALVGLGLNSVVVLLLAQILELDPKPTATKGGRAATKPPRADTWIGSIGRRR